MTGGGETRYALNNGVHIAYQVVGDGPVDLVLVCGTMSHVELWWSNPSARAMLERLASFSRLILFDKPGTGLSDPVPGAPTMDQRVNDILAVLDAAGSSTAVVLGYSEGGIASIVLAATKPERVHSLVLVSSGAQFEWDDDAPMPPEWYQRWLATFDEGSEHWGEGRFMALLAPTWQASDTYRPLLGGIERACMSPAMARAIFSSYRHMDVRAMAAAVRVPTLVLHSPSETYLPFELGVDLASRIPDARLVELQGPDHAVWIHNAETIPNAIEEFVTGKRPLRDDNVVVTTIVVIDLVRVGDATAHQRQDRDVAELVAELGGRGLSKTTNGWMATFARPARAIRFGRRVVESAAKEGIGARVGVHTGECVDVGHDVVGVAVQIAHRVTDVGRAGEVVVSSTVRDLVVGAGFEFRSRGEHDLEGVPGRWRVFAVQDDLPMITAGGYETDVRRPASLDGFGLTARELEVLMLVAEGHSNGDIAHELFISRKTASVHVSHILQKLGVANRAQAAALVHRLAAPCP